MPRTISVSEAKNKLSAMLNWAIKNQDGVIVESRGRPKAVILPYAQYESYLVLRENEQRRTALLRLEELAAVVQTRNQDLQPGDAEQLAEEITKEWFGAKECRARFIERI